MITPSSPPGKSYYPFQIEGIQYILDHDSSLVADEMGLGKTIQAIGAFNADETIHRCLVICPASLKINWKREFEEWATRPTGIIVVDGRNSMPHSRYIPRGYCNNLVVIVNYDIIESHRDWIDSLNWDLLIVDEVQYLKNPKAQRTRVVLGGRGLGRGRGKRKSIQPIKARKRLFLSGTPILNCPIELWPLVQALDPTGLGRSFVRFAYRYCAPRRTRWGTDFMGSANRKELSEKLRSAFMIRRLKSDVLPDLPPKRRQVIELPVDSEMGLLGDEKTAYDSYQEFLDRGGQQTKRKIAFGELAQLRHEVAVSKVPMVVEHLQENLENGPIVCFAHHRDVIWEIVDSFDPADVVMLTGTTSPGDRQKAVDDFQSGKANLFVGNIQAAGVGITLTQSQHVVFAELDWTPANLTQAEDRCHRIGQTGSLLIQHLVLENSLDARMVRRLIRKQKVIAEVLDNKGD